MGNLIGISGKKQSGKDTVGGIILELTRKRERRISGLLDKEVEYVGGHTFQIKKFADKLKDITCLLIVCTREELEDEVFKNTELGEEWWYYKPSDTIYSYLEYKQHEDQHHGIAIYKEDLIKPTPRLLLQLLGTECGRQIIHPSIWVNSLMNEYRGSESILWKNGDKTVNSNSYPNWIITDMRFPNELLAVKQRKGISIRVNTKWKHHTDGKHITAYRENEHESETALDNAEFDYTIYNNGTIEELTEKVKKILIKENII